MVLFYEKSEKEEKNGRNRVFCRKRYMKECGRRNNMFTIREYVKVSSLEEAYELNQKKANVVFGGGVWLRLGR